MNGRREPRFRRICGTADRRATHQARGESLCGWCKQAAEMARITAEVSAPLPGAGPYPPVTEAQARQNAIALDAEVRAYEIDHGQRISRGAA